MNLAGRGALRWQPHVEIPARAARELRRGRKFRDVPGDVRVDFAARNVRRCSSKAECEYMKTLENKALQSAHGRGTARSTVNVPAAASPAAVALRPKVEHFAQLYTSYGNASRAYREAFDVSPGTKPGTVWQRAYELVHEPTVAERVRQLLAQAAEGTTISARARMLRLQDIIEADPGEVFRIVTEPCAFCWRDPLALAAAFDQAIASGEPLPDTKAPQPDCPRCRGHGQQRVVVTDTDQLSVSARKLLRSVRQKASGEIEVRLHDQLAASDQLNRMQGSYIERSVTLNAHVAVKPLPAGLSVEDALRMLETIAPAPADDPTVVSDQ